jgi:hypothetical protein
LRELDVVEIELDTLIHRTARAAVLATWRSKTTGVSSSLTERSS